LNAPQIETINRHPVQRDEDSAPESISDTRNWLTWKCNLDNLNDSEDNYTADIESVIEQHNGNVDLENQEQQDVSARPNVPRLLRPIRKSKRQAEKVLVTVNAMETRRNKGINKKCDRMHQCFTSFFM